MDIINFDANAGHAILPQVRSLLADWNGTARNPSSIHTAGQVARALIEEAREEVGLLLGATKRHQIIFTSGATEANNLAFHLALGTRPNGEVVTTAIEHPCVLACAARAAAAGRTINLIGVARNDEQTIAEFRSHVTAQLAFASAMVVNNETGQLLPFAQLLAEVRKRAPQAIVHTDAVAAVGKVSFKLSDAPVDMCTISAHKIGALAGVGALVVDATRVSCDPLLVGGPQESRWRAGTENVLGIATFGRACRVVREHAVEIRERLAKQSELLREALRALIPGAVLHEFGRASAPNTISVRLPGCFADDLVVSADTNGLLLSSGAACSSGKPETSHVLRSLGLSEQEASETVRVSFELFAEDSLLLEGVERLRRCVAVMRGAA